MSHPMFLPNISSNVHLRHYRLCLREYINTVILCIFIGIAHRQKRRYAFASDDSGERVLLSENMQIKIYLDV